MIGLLFPGQGSQYPGMINALGAQYENVKSVFEEASDLTGVDIENLCRNAGKEELMQVQNTQLVMYVMNMAFYKALENNGIKPDITMGHSLGEYCALTASGCIEFKDAVKLVQKRAQLMAGVKAKGCLYSIVGSNEETIQKVCDEISDENGKVSIALHNTPKQIVIGGHAEYTEKAAEKLKELGALKTVKLAVGNAFHTPIMNEMQAEFTEYVNKVNISKPKCKIILNSTAEYGNEPDEIRQELINQCSKRVLWKQSMEMLLEYPDILLAEVGIGKVLTGMTRNIDKKVKVYTLEKPKLFKEFLNKASL